VPEPYAQDNQKLLPVAVISPAPLGASSANAAAANNVTITPPADKTAYVTGFEITGGGATAASVIAATLVGLFGGLTFTYDIAVPVGATVQTPSLIVEFSTPLPGNAKGSAITLNVPSFGAGNANAAVNLHGFAA
jgi:hypothetical protein